MTQAGLAARLGHTPSFVTKAERGDRRLDVVPLRTVLSHLGTTRPAFVARLEERLAAGRPT